MRGHQRGGRPMGGRGGHPGFGRHGHHHGGEERIGRILGHGDLRYIILHLLKENPRHGYELIKALEELSSGAYSPSPGAIYPTLTFLEEGGFATAKMDENKKQYTITKEGIALLKENEEFVTALLTKFSLSGERMQRLKHWMGRDGAEEVARGESSPIRKAMHLLKAELFSFIDATAEKKKRVAEIIAEAAAEVKKLKEEK